MLWIFWRFNLKKRYRLLKIPEKQAYLVGAEPAPVAQRIEHLTSNQVVTGSNPVRGAICAACNFLDHFYWTGPKGCFFALRPCFSVN